MEEFSFEDTTALFTRDLAGEKLYLDLRRNGEISDEARTDDEDTNNSGNRKRKIFERSRYETGEKKTHVRYEEHDRHGEFTQLSMEKKELTARELGRVIIVHGIKRVHREHTVQKDLVKMLKRKYHVAPTYAIKSDYCEDFWKIFFENEADVLTLDGVNTHMDLGEIVFVQFRRPLSYYQRRPSDVYTPVIVEENYPEDPGTPPFNPDTWVDQMPVSKNEPEIVLITDSPTKDKRRESLKRKINDVQTPEIEENENDEKPDIKIKKKKGGKDKDKKSKKQKVDKDEKNTNTKTATKSKHKKRRCQ
jgi:hypothetical protein